MIANVPSLHWETTHGGPGSPRPAVFRPNYVIMEMLNFVSDSSQLGSLPIPGNVDSWLARISIRMSWAVCRPGDCYNAQQDVGRCIRMTTFVTVRDHTMGLGADLNYKIVVSSWGR